MINKIKSAIFVMALSAMTVSAAKPFGDVFPANFSDGLPAGWSVKNGASVENVAGGIKVTCSQDAPNYRADIVYNMEAPTNNDAAYYFDINASEYSIFAIKFIGKRPESGVLKLSNIGIENEGIGWIKGKEGFSINEQGWTALTDLDGNTTYYWTVGGDKWTGTITVKQMEIVIADIKSDADKSYSVSTINWYKSVDDLKSCLNLNTVVNQTKGTGFDTLIDAWDAAENGDVLYVKADQSINKRLDCGERSLTIEGADGVKISREAAGNMMFLANKGGEYNLTLRNLTLDGLGAESAANFIEASGYSSVTLDNINVINALSSNNLGLIVAKGGGKLALNNVSLAGCSVNEGCGEVFFGTSYSTLSGDNVMSISVEKNNTFSVDGSISNTKPITVYNYGGQFEIGNILVNNCTDATRFTLGGSDLSLKANEGNLEIAEGSASISDIASDNETAVEYFNLHGIRVESPSNGIYICRKGDKVCKVVIK